MYWLLGIGIVGIGGYAAYKVYQSSQSSGVSGLENKVTGLAAGALGQAEAAGSKLYGVAGKFYNFDKTIVTGVYGVGKGVVDDVEGWF